MKFKKKVKTGKKYSKVHPLKKASADLPKPKQKEKDNEPPDIRPIVMNEQQREEELKKLKSSRTFIATSCAALGFTFCFLTSYGGLNLEQGLTSGMIGLLVGGMIGFLPYKL